MNCLNLNLSDEKSIYLQIGESVENDILRGILQEEERVPSTNEMARAYSINPATAAKGINLLVEEGVVYKKRGVGMFVAQGAAERLRVKRKEGFYDRFVASLVAEAKRLGIGKEELEALIARGFAQQEKEDL